MFSVSKFASSDSPLSKPFQSQRANPTLAVDDTDATTVYCDRRIVRTTGWWVHSDIFGKVLSFIADPLRGHYVNSIPIVPNVLAIAVNASETFMVVLTHKLHLYSLPDGELITIVGSVPFGWAGGVEFGPDDNTFLAVNANERTLTQFTIGTNKKVKVDRIINLTAPSSVCLSNDKQLIGVGAGDFTLYVLDFTSGDVLRSINCAAYVDGGSRFGYISSVQFTPDDTNLLVAEDSVTYVAMFCVADGSFVRAVCEGLGLGKKCVRFAANGDIVVADKARQRVSVFDDEGLTVKVTIGGEDGCGNSRGLVSHPVGVSRVGSHLYVFENMYRRVQVFE